MAETEFRNSNTDSLNDEYDQSIPEVVLSDDAIRDYLKKIGQVPLLNAVQEVELAQSIEVGQFAQERLDTVENLSDEDRIDLQTLVQEGKRSTDHLMNANQRLVVSIAKRYRGTGMDLLELVQEGNTGLFRAVEKFDYTQGFKFSTYASWWIRQSIRRAIDDTSRTIRIPVHALETLSEIHKYQDYFKEEFDREPTAKEIAEELDENLQLVTYLLQADRYEKGILSLDAPVTSEDDTTLGSVVSNPSSLGTAEEAEAALVVEDQRYLLDILMGGLSEREVEVIKHRYGLNRRNRPMTSAEIGEMFDITPQRAQQIARRAMEKIRRTEHFNTLARINADLVSD